MLPLRGRMGSTGCLMRSSAGRRGFFQAPRLPQKARRYRRRRPWTRPKARRSRRRHLPSASVGGCRPHRTWRRRNGRPCPRTTTAAVGTRQYRTTARRWRRRSRRHRRFINRNQRLRRGRPSPLTTTRAARRPPCRGSLTGTRNCGSRAGTRRRMNTASTPPSAHTTPRGRTPRRLASCAPSVTRRFHNRLSHTTRQPPAAAAG